MCLIICKLHRCDTVPFLSLSFISLNLWRDHMTLEPTVLQGCFSHFSVNLDACWKSEFQNFLSREFISEDGGKKKEEEEGGG